MNNRQLEPFVSSSAAIRQEIQRFESVHPSIYAIYDIIELIPDPLLAQQIREHVVCIEGKLSSIRFTAIIIIIILSMLPQFEKKHVYTCTVFDCQQDLGNVLKLSPIGGKFTDVAD